MSEKKPLIFFVHVPKTAGSTVNSYLKEYSPKGAAHCEEFINDEARMREMANVSDWLSGHIDLSTAEERLAAVTDRPIHYFSCVRDPFEHVVSHYNWLVEIQMRGDAFFNNHPQAVRNISHAIRKNSASTDEIIKNIQAHPILFLNYQSKFILGKNFNWNAGQIVGRLSKYKMVSTNESVANLVNKMTGVVVESTRRINVGGSHVPIELFDNPKFKSFLRRRNLLDSIVYRLVTGAL